MADVMGDTIGGMASGVMGGLGLVAYGIIGILVLTAIILFLWKSGRIWNNLKTVALNWEERGNSGDMTLVSQDLCGTQKSEMGIRYKLRQKNLFINPPPLKMISRIGNKDLVNFFWADRDEAYPFMPRRFTKDYIVNEVENAYLLHTTILNEDGSVKEAGRKPQTKEEFIEGLALVEAGSMIFFKPVVDESSANLVMTEIANVNSMYSNKFLSMLKEWAPMIGLVLVVLITIVGFMWIKDGLSSMHITCTAVETVAQQAVNNVPGMPEIP